MKARETEGEKLTVSHMDDKLDKNKYALTVVNKCVAYFIYFIISARLVFQGWGD